MAKLDLLKNAPPLTLAEVETLPTPQPLLPELTQPAPYPVDSLPPLMREAARAIAAHVQAPLPIAGQCVIGAAAYLAQTRVNAPHIHSPDGMPCALYMLTLADSGDRKSECRRLAFKTIDEAERRARSAQRLEVQRLHEQAEQLQGKARHAFLNDHHPPADPRTQYTDASFERIAGDLIRGLPAAAWDSDEGGQLFGGHSLKADNRAAILGALTKLFDNGHVERDRSHANLEGSGFAYHRRLTIHLLAQEITLKEALADPLLRGQGFLPRFLFTSAESIAGQRLTSKERLTTKSYADPALQRYWSRCQAIQDSPEAICAESAEVKPQALALTADGEQVWIAHYNATEAQLAPLGALAHLKPFGGRAGELARRLAAVFACFEGRHLIDAEIMRWAWALVNYSLSEWLRYSDAVAVAPQTLHAQQLSEWLLDPRRAHDWQTFHRNRLGKSGPPALRPARRRDTALMLLVAHGHLLTEDEREYRINPLLLAADSADAAERQPVRGFSSADRVRKAAEPGAVRTQSAVFRNSSAKDNPPAATVSAQSAQSAPVAHERTPSAQPDMDPPTPADHVEVEL